MIQDVIYLRAVELATNVTLVAVAVALAWAVLVHSGAVLVFAPAAVGLMAVSSIAGVIRWRREDRARRDAAAAALPPFTYIGS